MIKIKKIFINEMIDHAKQDAPKEACGILAGKNETIEKVYKMINTSDKPELCYFMDPKEQLKIMKDIRNAGMDMIGIYHSHTESEAYPSSKDMELAFYDEAAYFIISLEDKNNPQVRAFSIKNNEIKEFKLLPEDN